MDFGAGKAGAFDPVSYTHLSLPSRERGLKFGLKDLLDQMKEVAPFAGAWIEMNSIWRKREMHLSRSLRGSVD